MSIHAKPICTQPLVVVYIVLRLLPHKQDKQNSNCICQSGNVCAAAPSQVALVMLAVCVYEQMVQAHAHPRQHQLSTLHTTREAVHGVTACSIRNHLCCVQEAE